MSTKPGATTAPSASSTRRAAPGTAPSAAMRPSRIATSPGRAGAPVPSTCVPPGARLASADPCPPRRRARRRMHRAARAARLRRPRFAGRRRPALLAVRPLQGRLRGAGGGAGDAARRAVGDRGGAGAPRLRHADVNPRSAVATSGTDPPLTDPGAEASRRALAAERLRSTRWLGVFRFVGISIAFALNLLVPEVIPGARAFQSDVRLFACYWTAAAAVFWATRRSERTARLVGLDIVLIDMPSTFLLAWDVVEKNPGAAPLATSSGAFYMLLVMAAAFSLRVSRIILAFAVGAALEVLLLVLAGVGTQFTIWGVGVMAGVAAGCVYNTRRTINLVHSVADEHRRRERLGRYFSPQVAAHVERLAGGAANVAARIEQHTKLQGAAILVSEETRRQVREAVPFVPAGLLHLPGKSEPVPCYAPVFAEVRASRPATGS